MRIITSGSYLSGQQELQYLAALPRARGEQSVSQAALYAGYYLRCQKIRHLDGAVIDISRLITTRTLEQLPREIADIISL
jgi:hypothetical protein